MEPTAPFYVILIVNIFSSFGAALYLVLTGWPSH